MKTKQILLGFFIMVGVAAGATAADRYVAAGGTGNGSSWAEATGNLSGAVLGAPAGCTVWVSNGVYTLTGELVITNFAIRSYRDGALDAAGTVIRGDYPNLTNRCFVLSHTNALVEGFTITNGYVAGNGGGVYMTAGTLRNCLVTGNTATNGSGGGVYATGTGSLVTNCDLIANAAMYASGANAGGGGVKLAASAALRNSRILYNRSPLYWSAGGGVNSSGGSVFNCSIISNTASDGYGGGGVWVDGAGTTLRNCLITGSDDGRVNAGAGVGSHGGSAVIENCTIVGNAGAGIGTGWQGATYKVLNTVAYYNSAGDMTIQAGSLVVSNCCAASTNFTAGSSGNITNNPQFANAGAGNYRLTRESPCVDTGTNQPWMAGAADLDGSPRLDGASGIVDRGAYELVEPDAEAPAVDNAGGATGITTNSAWLNGNLSSAGGAPTTVFIYWGLTDGGTNTSDWSHAESLGTCAAGAFSAQVTGLQSDTAYYYRCCATNWAGAGWAPSTASFTTFSGGNFLVEHGLPCADIVITSNPPRMVVWAARELQTYLRKITGATVPIVTTNGVGAPVHLYVGRSAYTDQLGLSDAGLAGGAFRIVASNNWMAFLGQDTDYVSPLTNGTWANEMALWDARTGDTWDHPLYFLSRGYSSALGVWAYDKRGSMNAVHEYLRQLGCRWYFPGDEGEVVPSLSSLEVGDTNVVVHPDFPVRHLYFYYKEYAHGDTNDILWQWRLGLNMGDENLGVCARGHGILNVISRPETATNHPEYYKMLSDGTRATPDVDAYYGPCLSSTGLYARHTAYLDAVYDIYDQPLLNIGPTDGYATKCYCPLCAGKDAPARYPTGHLSDYVWGYANRIATNVLARHPGRKVDCLAYTAYLEPPTNLPALSSNLTVTLCQWRSQFYDPAVRATYTNLVTQWFDKTASKEMYIWDYYLHANHSQWDGVPVYFPHVIATNLSFLRGKSRGEFIEVYRHWADNTNETWEPMAANHLNCYLTSRLWWDATQDVDALLDDYCSKYYGPAATQMRSFINFCEAKWPNMRSDYTALCTMFDLLNAARAAAGSSGIYSQRIEVVNTYVQRLVPLRDSMAQKYVAHNGQTPVYPYLSWATAASNIQEAVDASHESVGTEEPIIIWVGGGHYTAPPNAVNYRGTNVVYIDRPLALRGTNSLAPDVVIDGEGLNRGIAVYYPKTTPQRFIFDGLIVTNGFATNTGGGLLLDVRNGSAVALWTSVVQNCVFVNNTVSNSASGTQGGGVYAGHANGVYWGFFMSNCVVRDNHARYGQVAGAQTAGGGLYATYVNGRVTACVFDNNSATVGGGLSLSGGSNPLIERCVVTRNWAKVGTAPGAGTYEPRAGGAYLPQPVTLRNCLFATNRSDLGCGQIYMGGAGTYTLENCTVANSIEATSGYGGPVYLPGGGKLVCVNSIIASNCLNLAAAYRISILVTGTGYAYITNSFVSPVPWNGWQTPGGYSMTDSISSGSPGFQDFGALNLRLADSSPCIDTGTNMPWMTGALDLDGGARVDSLVGVVDMGAYESVKAAVSVNNGGGATGVVARSAWLRGSLATTSAAPASVFIFWGAADGGTNPAAWAHADSLGARSPGVFSNQVTGLSPSTAYYYRCCATNEEGAYWAGASAGFTTLPALPPGDRYVATDGTGDGSSWANATTNIREAVLSATPGYTVWVSNGVYVLNGDLVITNFSVRSYHDGVLDPDGTIINGNGATRCFTLAHANAVVDGFTITNGCVVGNGGGVTMSAGTLRNCRVTGNTATNGSGGGVYATGAGSVVTNCDIVANAALYAAGASAGGGGLKLSSSASVWNSRILYNRSPLYWSAGGGVNSSGGSVFNCSIISNTASDGYGGGGVWVDGSANTLRNCLIAGSDDGRANAGAGVGAHGGGAVIENCTIVGNFGAGIGTGWQGATYKVLNTVAYGNSGGDMTIQAGSLIASNCCASSTNYVTGGSGNITVNPQFVNAAGGNYRLAAGSPCINTGTNQAWMTGAADLDGAARINPVSGIVDMGAYEFAEAIPEAPAVDNGAGASGITGGSAWLNGNLSSTGGVLTSVIAYWGAADGGTAPAGWEHAEILGIRSTGVFSIQAAGLSPNATYFYRCYATNVAGGSWAPAAASFATPAVLPEVDNAGGASEVTAGSAWLNGTLTATGGAPSSVWIYWGPTDGGAVSAAWAHASSLGVRSTGMFSNQVTGLDPNAAYYYRCCAANAAGTNWAASSAAFTTPGALPGVDNAGGAANVAATRAWLRGTLTSTGGLSTAVTVYWGLTDGGTTNSRWSNTNQLGVRSIGLFSNEVTTLTMNRTYYYRCFASNALGGMWAPVSTNFTTTFDLAQVDNDGGARGMTISAAWLRGTLTSTGGAPTAVFIYSGLTDGGTNPANWSRTNGLGIRPTGLFSNQVTALQTNALYYYRCCASNVMGRSWAAETTNFWTLAAVPAVNNTNGATGITSASAWLRGTLTSTGGAPTTVIIYWGPSDRGASSSGWARTNNLGLRSTGVFSNQVSGLTASTRYYYRCCATNKAGLAWASTTANFKTLSGSLKSGTGAIAPAALSDLDGDGATYDDELRTGTDPDDNYSSLRIMAVDRVDAEALDLTLYLGSNRTYSILSADARPDGEPFRASITSGAEGVYHWIDTNAASAAEPRFYRIRVVDEDNP